MNLVSTRKKKIFKARREIFATERKNDDAMVWFPLKNGNKASREMDCEVSSVKRNRFNSGSLHNYADKRINHFPLSVT